MLFKSIFVFALCGVAFSSDIEKRSAKPIVDAVSSISAGIKDLTVDITAFRGDPKDVNKILSKAESMLKLMTDATKEISEIAPLSLLDSAQVLGPGNALIAEVQKVVTALITMKRDVEKQNLSGVVVDILTKYKSTATEMVLTVKGKLPSAVGPVGDTIVKNINIALDKGIAAFSDAPPTPMSYGSSTSILTYRVTSTTPRSTGTPRSTTSRSTTTKSTGAPKSTRAPKSSTSSPKSTGRPKGSKGPPGGSRGLEILDEEEF
jgi:hypothetical protein